MKLLPFSEVGSVDQALAIDTLTSAFSNDPVERWLYPEDDQYFNKFPGFLRAFGGRSFEASSAWMLGEVAAVALWLPPGTDADGDAIVSVLTETVASEKLEDTYSVLTQMDEAHPTYEHWYLPWFGVNLALQGNGLGAQLMLECLQIVDRDHCYAYLETPNPRTISFYNRHGFEVTGYAQSGSCPPITFMSRTPH
jgi:ribosomal protein S18 acetylase RimI-like enzyme